MKSIVLVKINIFFEIEITKSDSIYKCHTLVNFISANGQMGKKHEISTTKAVGCYAYFHRDARIP